jgi:hypothetical protein
MVSKSDNNESSNVRDNKTFGWISLGYVFLLSLATGIIYIFYDAFSYEKMNGLFFYLVVNYALDIVYFHFLQTKIKKRRYPGTSSLSAVCVSAALAIGIVFLLSIGKSQIDAFMLLIFFPIFAIATIFAGYRLWIQVEYKD